jgi:hypothetical protein
MSTAENIKKKKIKDNTLMSSNIIAIIKAKVYSDIQKSSETINALKFVSNPNIK